MNRLECVKQTMEKLRGISDCEPLAEAKHITCSVLNCDFSALYLDFKKPVPSSALTEIEKIVAERITGKPLAYILKGKWFYGLFFRVNPEVLIPRYDTEILVQTAIDFVKKQNCKNVLDVCTGSGCIAICVAKNTSAQVSGSDISPGAIELAGGNARENNADVSFFWSDMFSNIIGKYDLILSNPPYISDKAFASLPKQIREYEPSVALKAGDGLQFYRRIAKEAPARLAKGGRLIVEIGDDQATQITRLFLDYGLAVTDILNDLGNAQRVLIAKAK